MEETFANNLVDSFKLSLSLEADIQDSQISSPHTEKKKKYSDLWRPNALITSDFKLIHIHKYQCLYKRMYCKREGMNQCSLKLSKILIPV